MAEGDAPQADDPLPPPWRWLIDDRASAVATRATRRLWSWLPVRPGPLTLLLFPFVLNGILAVWILFLLWQPLRLLLLVARPFRLLLAPGVAAVAVRWGRAVLAPPATTRQQIGYVITLPLRLTAVVVLGYAVVLVSLLRLMALVLSLGVLLGLAEMTQLPAVAWWHGVDARDVAVRCLDTHALDPFYLLESAPGFRRDDPGPTAAVMRAGWVSVRLREYSPAELQAVKAGLAAMYPPGPHGFSWRLLAWGEVNRAQQWGAGLFVLRASSVRITGGDEAQRLGYAWQRLCAGNPHATRDLPRLTALFHQAYPSADDRTAALAWARLLYERYRVNAMRYAAHVLDGKAGLRSALPPEGESTFAWMVYQYVGLTDESRHFARDRWLSYFPPESADAVLRWGRQLEAERRAAGEPLPPSSETVALVCVVERLTGSDGYGERCRRVADGVRGPGYAVGTLLGAITFAYPNDDLLTLVAAGDPLALVSPQAGDTWTVLLHLALVCVGLRLWVFQVVGYPLRNHPAFVRYRDRDLRDWRGLLLAYVIAPLLLWPVAWWTLPPPLWLLVASPLQCLAGVFVAVLLGGNLVLLLTRLIALVLIARGYALERTWLDEVLGAAVGAAVLLYFGNNLSAVAVFVGFAVLPEMLARRRLRDEAATAQSISFEYLLT